jgi:phage terminase Nu1 subunit (DNA packaging protein)
MARGAGPSCFGRIRGTAKRSIFVDAKFFHESCDVEMSAPKNARAAPLAAATKQRGRLAAAQADIAEQKAARMRGETVLAAAVEAEWSGILRTVRAGMLAVPSRVAARLPHLTRADVAEIDQEIRAVLGEIGN